MGNHCTCIQDSKQDVDFRASRTYQKQHYKPINQKTPLIQAQESKKQTSGNMFSEKQKVSSSHSHHYHNKQPHPYQYQSSFIGDETKYFKPQYQTTQPTGKQHEKSEGINSNQQRKNIHQNMFPSTFIEPPGLFSDKPPKQKQSKSSMFQNTGEVFKTQSHHAQNNSSKWHPKVWHDNDPPRKVWHDNEPSPKKWEDNTPPPRQWTDNTPPPRQWRDNTPEPRQWKDNTPHKVWDTDGPGV